VSQIRRLWSRFNLTRVRLKPFMSPSLRIAALSLQPHESSSETLIVVSISSESCSLQPHESSSETTQPVREYHRVEGFNLTRVRLKPFGSLLIITLHEGFNLTRVRLKRLSEAQITTVQRRFNLTRVRLKRIRPRGVRSQTSRFNLTRVRLKRSQRCRRGVV